LADGDVSLHFPGHVAYHRHRGKLHLGQREFYRRKR
jgi:hypothetical protein